MAGLRLDLGPVKEPLGLVRGLQWFFSIFAFAALGGFSGSVSFLVSCADQSNVSVSAPFGYPFRLNLATFSPSLATMCNGTWGGDVHLRGDFSSPAQFFVAVAVCSFLGSAAALGLYLSSLPRYRAPGGALPTLDLVATSSLALLWLLSASAWARALGDIKASVGSPLPDCGARGVSCLRDPPGGPPVGALNASVAFGFLNLLLWAGSSWFVYKETKFHRPAPPPPGPAPL